MVNSKKKGNRFELEIAKLFSVRFEDKFTRTPTSGAHSTIHGDNLSLEGHKILSGDIICPNWFEYSVELKSGYGLSFTRLVLGKKTDSKLVKSWIEQCNRDAQRASLKPLIIYKKERIGTYVIVTEEPLEGNYLKFEGHYIFPLENWLKEQGV